MIWDSTSRHCFTLWECFAVITIIIVLVSIFMPLGIKAREWGKSISCKGNMKSISEALFTYNADNTGFFPYDPGYPNGMSWVFRLQLYGYLKDPKKFIYVYGFGSYKTTGNFIGYPADYSSVWACPSQEIAKNNRGFSKIVFNDPNYPGNDADGTYKGFYWRNCHYGLTGGINYGYTNGKGEPTTTGKSIQQFGRRGRGAYGIGLLIDGPGGGATPYFWNGAWSGSGCGTNILWVRHFGKAIGANYQNYKTGTYLEIGSAQLNTIFMDGHQEAWSNKIWWTKYVIPYGTLKTPFTIMW